MAGIVYVGEQRVDKPGQTFASDADLRVKGKEHPYVSRGGLKLAKALDCFAWSVEGLRCLDLGASTGGFTDCMLQRGASHVVAVDVGKGQLDLKLREDPRVTVMDKTNARYLSAADVPYTPDFISIDVAFISLSLILPVAERLLSGDGRVVALIKPQFEAGREKIRKGVVTDPEVHREVLRRVPQFSSLVPVGLTYSPVRGPAGNLEFLGGFRRQGPAGEWNVEAVVAEAHQL